MDYQEVLNKKFSDKLVTVVKHDTSPTGYPLYIEMTLGSNPKDKGAAALDAGNYLYRKFGVAFEPIPEYRGKGKKTTIRWFVSWDRASSLIDSIKAMHNETHIKGNYIPFEFQSAFIQGGHN